MKTLIVLPWDHARGGVVSVVENLTKHLRARGHEVLFLHPGPSTMLKARTTRLGYPGVELRLNMPVGNKPHRILRAMAFPFLFIFSMGQLLWFLRRQRIDVVNLHYLYDSFFYFALCRFLAPIRLVSSVHGRDAFSQERPKARYSWAFRLLMGVSDLIVLPSEAYRRKLLEAFPGAKDRTICIHNGVDPAQFKPLDSNVQLRTNEKYVLCVAELKDYKGIDILLRAASLLVTSDRSLSFGIAGDGPERQDFMRLAVELGIEDRVDFLGTQGADEIVELLQHCEMLVLPSREEPFGIVIIEAMACRKPVIASAIGGIPEIIEHRKTGILVDPEDPTALAQAIRSVLANDALRDEIAGNGHSMVLERFCFYHTGHAYEQALQGLLGSRMEARGTIMGARKRLDRSRGLTER